jgi:predicted nucleotidyltransferase
VSAIPEAVRVLPSGYQNLFRRARELFESDERVRGMWLGGSLARGTADAASDLDVIVAVLDDAHESFTSSWRAWLAEITPTVLAEELPFARGSFYSVTPGFERFDVVVEPASHTPATFFRTRAVVFDHDGLTERIPAAEPGPGPSAEAIGALITEYFRISAVETVLVRDDWLLAREHIHLVASLVYRLFAEANAPLPPMGVKQWSTKLTPAQRALMASLPTTAANVEELRRAHLAVAEVFLANAEAMARSLGIVWPDALEQAAGAHVGRLLGLADPYPRSDRVVVGLS